MRPIRSRWVITGLTAALTWSVGVSPGFAHHSFGMYDMTKSSEIDGTVSKMEWSNPHCWLFVIVVSPDGEQTIHGFEMTSVGEMHRRGWTKTILMPGDKVKVKYHPLRDGRLDGYLMSVITPDGRVIGLAPAGQSGQGAAPPPAEPSG